jgi:aryl-alcohol dehydrogenase-like predicted oxidoreductase
MNLKKLGNSDLAITPIGFGAWAIGGNGWEFGWGAQDDADSVAAIHRALELGVNWIDTAAIYGFGHSEKVVAKALKSWKGQRPYVFTKCGMVAREDGSVDYCIKPDYIIAECEASLKRLETDVIDLYQIHWPSDDIGEIEAAWQAMNKLRQDGKVRWVGVSNFSVQELQEAQKVAPVTSLQPPYSLINREVEHQILPYCLQQSIGTIVYSPMGSGLLTGAMTRERIEKLPDDDWRAKKPPFQEPQLTRNLAIAATLKQIGERRNLSAGQIAIAWTLHNVAVSGAIVGARNPGQVDGVMSVMDLSLSKDEVFEIESI